MYNNITAPISRKPYIAEAPAAHYAFYKKNLSYITALLYKMYCIVCKTCISIVLFGISKHSVVNKYCSKNKPNGRRGRRAGSNKICKKTQSRLQDHISNMFHLL